MTIRSDVDAWMTECKMLAMESHADAVHVTHYDRAMRLRREAAELRAAILAYDPYWRFQAPLPNT